MEVKQESTKYKIISNLVDLIYSKERLIERVLIMLVILGLILRIIAALNLSVLADDMVYASQSAGILSSGIISTHSNPPLFFYLTDLIYLILGYTTLASRFWPLLGGILLIPLVFLISTKVFNNKKIGIMSAFLVTFSAFMIRMTFTEMSLLVLFFCFTGVYLGLLFLDTKKLRFLIISSISFGLSMQTKYSTPFFILAFFIFSLYTLHNNKEKIINKKNLKYFILFLIPILLFSLPFITFNYLLYKDKGLTDVYFSRVIQNEKTQEFYSGLGGQENSFFDNLLNKQNYGNILLPLKTDTLIFILGFLGIILLLYQNKRKELVFIMTFLIIPFILQSPGSPLPKHFVFMVFILSLPAAYFINEVGSKISSKNFKIFLFLTALILIINIGNSYATPSSFLSASPTSEIKNYLIENADKEDLIILDNRIYTSQAFWIATPYHFIDTMNFIDFYSVNLDISENNRVLTDVFIVECVSDDCGWGTIKSQPNFNSTIEKINKDIIGDTPPSLVSYKKIYGWNEFIVKKSEYEEYKVYKKTVYLNPLILNQLDSTNSFYFVPYLYKNMNNYPFNYQIKSLFDRLLEKLSYYVIFISMILTVLLVVYFIYVIINESKNGRK